MEIEMRGISKSFSTVQVLKEVQFSLRSGEIHALMGENGAGKSTLMNILTGVHHRDAGEIMVDGKPVNFTHPAQAEKAGIVFIHQELNTMPDLTVEENMFMGKEICTKMGLLDKRAMRKRADEVIQVLGVHLSPGRTMNTLSVGQQQMVEIAKALLNDVKVIIMDEPTAALTLAETKVLFQVAKSLREKGVSIVYISHRMEEIFELCDRITVLRDGEYVGTKLVSETDMPNLIRMMIGRDIGERFPERHAVIGQVVLEVQNIDNPEYFHDVSFSVRAGEILGVAGLMGAGRTEIMKSIFGILPHTGQIFINGNPVQIHNPDQAKKHGIGYITEDRKDEGLMLLSSIKHNISLPNLDKITTGKFLLSAGKENALSEKLIDVLSIRCSGAEQVVGTLSGGNQQKVVFAQWTNIDPHVLILDEPTRGVDVGAKKEIYCIINNLAEQGVAIIMVSSDLPEILGMSDYVLVIHEGRAAKIVAAAEATQEKIMILATGGTLG